MENGASYPEPRLSTLQYKGLRPANLGFREAEDNTNTYLLLLFIIIINGRLLGPPPQLLCSLQVAQARSGALKRAAKASCLGSSSS